MTRATRLTVRVVTRRVSVRQLAALMIDDESWSACCLLESRRDEENGNVAQFTHVLGLPPSACPVTAAASSGHLNSERTLCALSWARLWGLRRVAPLPGAGSELSTFVFRVCFRWHGWDTCLESGCRELAQLRQHLVDQRRVGDAMVNLAKDRRAFEVACLLADGEGAAGEALGDELIEELGSLPLQEKHLAVGRHML